jgi:hypothetical protein
VPLGIRTISISGALWRTLDRPTLDTDSDPEFALLEFDERLFAAALRVLIRFLASPANSPFGYLRKYSRKSSGSELFLIDSQNTSSLLDELFAAGFLTPFDFLEVEAGGFGLLGVFALARGFFGVVGGGKRPVPPCPLTTSRLINGKKISARATIAASVKRATCRRLSKWSAVCVR